MSGRATVSFPMVPINRGHAEVSVPYKQQHQYHRQTQENTELFAFGAGAIGTRVLHVRALIMGRMERVMEAHSRAAPPDVQLGTAP